MLPMFLATTFWSVPITFMYKCVLPDAFLILNFFYFSFSQQISTDGINCVHTCLACLAYSICVSSLGYVKNEKAICLYVIVINNETCGACQYDFI
jgi:hypothetical protein